MPRRLRMVSLLALPLGIGLSACRREPSEDAARPPAPAAAKDADASAPASAALPEQLGAEMRRLGLNAGSAMLWTGRGPTAVFRIRVPGATAISLWESFRAAVDRTGHWPVVVGTDAAVKAMDDLRDGAPDRDPAAVLAEARAVDFTRWLKDQRDGDPESFEVEPGEWPETSPVNTTYSVTEDAKTHRPLAAVWLALVPTARSFEVPAFLPFGDWNDCPPDAVHVAALRQWSERWGAELVCLAHDTMELRAARRPATREEALQLAEEHFVYCSDSVLQGVGTVEALAADRAASPVWYFWWD